MLSKIYQGNFAGHTIRFRLQYSGTRYFFSPSLTPAEGDHFDLTASEESMKEMRSHLPEGQRNTYVEYRALLQLTARALLEYDCFIFHAVSFVKDGKAYLLSAPPGTGKTTQYLNWQRLFPGEITMISGDMPVLEGREDGTVWAHPSAWNGKENFRNRISAPVAGIVLLSQGKENRIGALTAHDAVFPFMNQFMVRPETEEEICALARILDRMLRNIPCLSFTNTGDEESTAMLRGALANCRGKENDQV